MMNFKKLRNSLAEELAESTALYEEMSIPPQPNAPPSESIIRFINLGTIAEYSIIIISLFPQVCSSSTPLGYFPYLAS